MTDQATEHLLLEDAARRAREQEQIQRRLQAAKALADYREAAPAKCREVAIEVLGDYAAEATWEATGGPSDFYDWSAIAEIDGLRFLATIDHDYDYRRQRLFLLRPCGNFDHPPTDRRIQIVSLAQVADAIDALANPQAGTCPACALMEDTEQPPPVSSAQERLVEALETVIEDRIGQRLDGFLSTYLPDRI